MTDAASPQPRLAAADTRNTSQPYGETPWYSWAMVLAFEAVMLAWLVPLVRAAQSL